jgi:hypothetical protein
VKLRIPALVCALALPVWCATSTVWEVNGFSDFVKGRLSGLSLTADGILAPGPSVESIATLGQPALWTMVTGPDGNLYAATGHQGKVFRITADGKSSEVWSSPQPEIFALCFDSNGHLYAGTSPNGGIYRIDGNNGVQIWRSPSKYIWSLSPGPDNTLFAATGERGQIYRIDSKGQGTLYYDTGQMNVTALAIAPNGYLYAGTDPNGLLYEITGPQKASVLYDSSLPEIRSIVIAPNGTIYAAAMGGAVATRTGTPASSSTATPTAVTATTPTVITVTESSDQPSAVAPPGQTTSAASSSNTSSAATAAVTEISGVEKSAIYKITPDHTVQSIRSSKEDNVYDLQLDGDSLLFSTDARGRLYRLQGNRITLLSELADGVTTRVLLSGSQIFAGMSNPARVFHLGETGAGPGSYVSQVHDSTSVARWGHLQWHGSGSGVTVRTRTGFSARPDGTWSHWSEPISVPGVSLISSPVGRFIQWQAEWKPGASSRLDTVDIPYLPQNTPPAVHSITVSAVVGTSGSKSAATTAASTTAYSITVTDTGEAPAASSSNTSSQTVSRLQTTQTQISWQADDPDGDKLTYAIYFRPDDATEWQLIRSRMSENTLLLDPDVFADGRYYFRVVASDSPSNAPEFAREAEMISTPVLIDSTPPVVTVGQPKRQGTVLDIDVEGADATSPLRVCEYALDTGSWQPINSVDGITDSPRGRFHLHLEKLRPGEHLIVFRIYDAAGNAGLGRVLLR